MGLLTIGCQDLEDHSERRREDNGCVMATGNGAWTGASRT